MLISREDGLWGRDCQIPARFIRDEMQSLDLNALKLYLFLHLLTLQGETEIRDNELGRALSLREHELKEAISLLLRCNLVSLSKNQLELRDYHRLQLEKEQKRQAAAAHRPRQASEEEERKNDIIRQINDTFFHGNMPHYFYESINRWFTDFQFEPAVVYALFQEAMKGNKLRHSSYADAIALNWSRNGVHTFDDLNRMSVLRQEEMKTARMISGKLKIGQLNDYQMKAVRRWRREWNFGDEALNEALKRASLHGRPSFNYIEGILRQWHEAGVSELKDILAYEEKRKPLAPRAGQRASSVIGNFEQREYSDDEIESLVYIPGYDEALAEEEEEA